MKPCKSCATGVQPLCKPGATILISFTRNPVNHAFIRKFLSGLRKLQKALNMDNTEFSAIIDVSRSTLSRWYSGETKPDPETIDRAIALLGELHADKRAEAHSILDFIALYSPVRKS